MASAATPPGAYRHVVRLENRAGRIVCSCGWTEPASSRDDANAKATAHWDAVGEGVLSDRG